MTAQRTNTMRSQSECSASLRTLCANGATHASLGQRPRIATRMGARAESPIHFVMPFANWAGLAALGDVMAGFLGLRPRLVWIAPLAHRQPSVSRNIKPRFGTISARPLPFSKR